MTMFLVFGVSDRGSLVFVVEEERRPVARLRNEVVRDRDPCRVRERAGKGMTAGASHAVNSRQPII